MDSCNNISPIEQSFRNCVFLLKGEQNSDGFWIGYLSSSALATALSIIVLKLSGDDKYISLIDVGLNWLLKTQNRDGGWGDSPESPSNLSTSLICKAALSFKNNHEKVASALERSDVYIMHKCGGLDPASIASSVLKFYGDDRTFSAPILTVCAITGLLGESYDRWSFVPQLPFEMSVVPHWFYKKLRLPVVSYAIPALIAIGLVKHQLGLQKSSFRAHLRELVKNRALNLLEAIQPCNGGFIEAIPLTAFVTISLLSLGMKSHPIAQKGINFIVDKHRPDGSWPIDTNLSTWNTTLIINALQKDKYLSQVINNFQKQKLIQWLVQQQFKTEHVYTHAQAGGWGWTDQPGAAPDADDTSGALIALYNLTGGNDVSVINSVASGLEWLLDIQNSDGGIPTFCKGWGRLLFDKSCPDITAHAIEAFSLWNKNCNINKKLQRRLHQGLINGIKYLEKSQNQNGSWTPLWFGNQFSKDYVNLTYGTAKVVRALSFLDFSLLQSRIDKLIRSGCEWLVSSQNNDGSWGGDIGVHGSVEETALAVSALGRFSEFKNRAIRGYQWIFEKTDNFKTFSPEPIGLYFAALWYSERLYPVIFSCSALTSLLD